jgi:hypothetical protein
MEENRDKPDLCEQNSYLLYWMLMRKEGFDEEAVSKVIGEIGPGAYIGERIKTIFIGEDGRSIESYSNVIDKVFKSGRGRVLDEIIRRHVNEHGFIEDNVREMIGLSDLFLSRWASKGSDLVMAALKVVRPESGGIDMFQYADDFGCVKGHELFSRMVISASDDALMIVSHDEFGRYHILISLDCYLELVRRARIQPVSNYYPEEWGLPIDTENYRILYSNQ